MIPRIQELKQQAGIQDNPDQEGLDLFAELIVRDCMDVVDGYTKPRTFETHYDAVAQIEALFGIKHNGVEE
jgi:hypothetical protein